MGVHYLEITMSEAAHQELAGHGYGLGAGTQAKPEDDPALRDALKRCSPATREAAREFRRTRGIEHIPAIVEGVIEHYVDPDMRAKMKGDCNGLRLVEDLSIDSLDLLEIVFLAEEVLQISIDNEEVRPFRTIGDVKGLIASKVQRAAS
jgi:3-hydroxyacyl-[acyl-carrier-protein] dehydratase